MKVLVTGHLGKIGACVTEVLRGCDHEVVGFDVTAGGDLLDLAAVKRAAAGCAAIVHLGGLAHDTAGPSEQIMAVNVVGTWHVLLAAEVAEAMQVIHFSSVQALGIAEGERLPDYFPVDDQHPTRATRPYGLSKRLAEDLCEAFTARTAIPTLSLRPVGVWQPDMYAQVRAQRRTSPQSEWLPFWEYGAFVDIRDVAAAVMCALQVAPSGHHRTLLCAADISASAPALALAERLAAGVPVRNPERYRADPSRALIDCSAAHALLGWQPRHRWSQREPTT